MRSYSSAILRLLSSVVLAAIFLCPTGSIAAAQPTIPVSLSLSCAFGAGPDPNTAPLVISPIAAGYNRLLITYVAVEGQLASGETAYVRIYTSAHTILAAPTKIFTKGDVDTVLSSQSVSLIHDFTGRLTGTCFRSAGSGPPNPSIGSLTVTLDGWLNPQTTP